MTLNLDKCEFSVQNIKFYFSKDCELVLSRTVKLRDMCFRISEDHSRATQTVQKTLLGFAKAGNQKFRLRHNKLLMNGKWYICDKHSNSVVER